MKNRRNHTVLAAFASLLLLVTQYHLLAATRAWTGGGGIAGAGWNVAANWTNNVLPTRADDIYFPSSGILRATINNLLTNAHSITLGDDGYSIVGNSLTWTNAIQSTNTSGVNALVSEIVLGVNQSFTNANPDTQLTVALLDLAGRGATFRGAGTNLVQTILDTTGNGGLTNLGTGIFLLTGSNSFTSPTALSAGTNIINGFHRRSPVTWTAGTLGGTGHLGQVTASGATAKQLA